MPNSNKMKTGRQGEKMAADLLTRSGYELIAQNYRAGHDELDIVARQGDTLVFVEVKTARSKNFGAPETWVDQRKQQHIGAAADAFLIEHDFQDVDCRFDVIAIDLSQSPPRINHIKDAFWLEE